MAAELQKALTIFIHLPNSKLAQVGRPGAVVGTDPGIEVSKEKDWFLLRYGRDQCAKVVIEFFLRFRRGGERWCISADEADQARCCLKLDPEHPLGPLCRWYDGTQQLGPDGEANAMLSNLFRRFALPEECEVFLSDAARGRESCLLEGDNIHVEPAQFVVDHSGFASIIHSLQII